MHHNTSFQQRTPDPCQQLAAAKDAYFRLITGGATQEIETPSLGRVMFSKADSVGLLALIEDLTKKCNQASGQTYKGRHAISIEGAP